MLIVEDEAIIALEIKLCLRKAGHEVMGLAVCSEEALSNLERNHVDLVLIDISINGRMDGIQLAEIVSERYGIPFIYLTGNSDEETRKRAMESKPSGYIVKPFSWNEIRNTVDAVYPAPEPSSPVGAGSDDPPPA